MNLMIYSLGQIFLFICLLFEFESISFLQSPFCNLELDIRESNNQWLVSTAEMNGE